MIITLRKELFNHSDMNKYIGNEIADILPMKEPYMILNELYVDKGIESKCIIRLTGDEWFLKCHFPSNPILPGFLLLEAMSEVLLSVFSDEMALTDDKVPLMAKVSNIVFNGYAIPGDEIEIIAVLDKFKYGVAKGSVSAYKDNGCDRLASVDIQFVDSNLIQIKGQI